MAYSPVAPLTGAEHDHDHAVQFYETDEFLVATVADFLTPALQCGDAAVVVATPEHREAFAAAMTATGIDVDAAVRDTRYLAFDAQELLSAFMVGGAPDPRRFETVVGSVLNRACAGGRRVRVYGEMVALLWADGDVTSTIALEDMWNDLARVMRFSLLCAYPMQGFDDRARAAFRRICHQHSAVVPALDRAPVEEAAQWERRATELQQEALELRAELTRLRTALADQGR